MDSKRYSSLTTSYLKSQGSHALLVGLDEMATVLFSFLDDAVRLNALVT